MSHEAGVPFVLARRQFLQRIPCFVNESDPCSNVRYLSSIENKARKKLRHVIWTHDLCDTGAALQQLS